MADGTDEFVRALTRLLAELIREAGRLAVELAELRAEKLRLAAQRSERAARAERARLAGHRAADAAIWRRTADPVWWRKATPEQIARAWRAASTWHQVDPDAAGARQVMAERLRRRGVDVDTDHATNPGDARWLQTALDLALAERDEQAALAAEHDGDFAVHADELMWDLDELPRLTALADPEKPGHGATASQTPPSADELLWAVDELTADELARRRAAGTPPASAAALPSEIVDGDVVAADDLPSSVSPDPVDPTVLSEDGQVSATGAAADFVTGRPSPGSQASDLEPRTAADVEQAAVAPVAAGHGQAPAAPPADEGPWPSTAAAGGQPSPAGAPPLNVGASGTDLARMEQILRSVWPADGADRVLHDPSWPALASTMQGLDRTGKDVPKLLRDLPINTTDAKVPAMLTAWALRAAARGPLSLGRAVREREHHLQRTQAARQAAERRTAGRERHPDGVVVPPAAETDGAVARLLAAAFPTTTKDALNRPTAVSGQSAEPLRDHVSAREPVAAER